MQHQVREFRNSNGSRGLVVHVPGSSVAVIKVVVRSGYQFANPAKYEIPHVLEHLMATVTKHHATPNGFMIDASRNGAYVNATTDPEVNMYLYECAAFELDRMLELVREQVLEPLFDETAFAAEISNVREELTRNTTNHMPVCSVALGEKMWPRQWKNYTERIAQLPDITLRDLEAHYRKMYVAQNMRFYVAGDFPDGGEAVAQKFERMFDGLEKGERPELDTSIGRGTQHPITTVREIDQLYYRSAVAFGELPERERTATVLLRSVLAGGMDSRVLGEARRKGLAYSVGAGGRAGVGNSSFGFSGYVTLSHAEELFGVIGHHVSDIAAGGATRAELDAAKDRTIGGIARSTQTAGDILWHYLDRYDDEDVIVPFDDFLDELRSIELDEITRVAQQMWASPERGVSFVGPIEPDRAAHLSNILFTGSAGEPKHKHKP